MCNIVNGIYLLYNSQMSDISLNSLIVDAFRTTEAQKKALVRLQLQTVRDLLYHMPSRYGHIATIKNISELNEGDEAGVYGKKSYLSKQRRLFDQKYQWQKPPWTTAQVN